MKLKRLSFALMMILFSSVVIFSGCQSKKVNKQQETDVYYTCSMHPQIHKDKPGNCPICGMKLIKVMPTSNGDMMPLDSSLIYLTQDVTKTVVGSFKVIEPVKTEPDDTIAATGYIGFDKRNINNVNTRVTGRIEKLYIKYSNQRIHKGQPLMTIYSPELLSTQKDLLQVVKDNDQSLIISIKEKLLNLGMRANEIQKVLQSGKPLTRITIYSPYNGISQKTTTGNPMNNVAPSNSMSSSQTEMGMGGSNMSAPETMATGQVTNQPEGLNIREGMYVSRGQTVFAVQNINKTWAILNVFTENVSHIQPGDPVGLYADADPQNIIKGHIDFIPPYREQGKKTTQVRVYLNSIPDSWKIGTLIHGRITLSEENKGWYVPLSAVNDLGMHKVVWIQDKEYSNIFHAREVETGLQTEDSIEVISGIKPGDKIAANAAYMVGSESFIQ